METKAPYDVLVTGGTSPLGDHLLPPLVESGRRILATARTAAAASSLEQHGVDVAWHEFGTALRMPKARATVILHLAGIRFASELIPLARDVCAARTIAVSSASATAVNHPQRDSILAAEERISALRISTAILRPTMIYGSSRDRNIRRLHRLVDPLPGVPYLRGGGLIMPVFIDDVVRAIMETLDDSVSGVRPVGGPQPVRIGDVVDALCDVNSKPRVPLRLNVDFLASVANRVVRNPGKAMHALQMLTQDRIVAPPPEAGFRYATTPLVHGVALAVGRYEARAEAPDPSGYSNKER
jgi:nucleoside-diphosphate-sugar epimerase